MQNSRPILALVFTIVLVLAAFTLVTLRATTTPYAAQMNSGYVGCRTEAWLDEANEFISTNRAALAAYFAFGRCFALEYGTPVTVTSDSRWTTKFTYRGAQYYAVHGAVSPLAKKE